MKTKLKMMRVMVAVAWLALLCGTAGGMALDCAVVGRWDAALIWAVIATGLAVWCWDLADRADQLRRRKGGGWWCQECAKHFDESQTQPCPRCGGRTFHLGR